MLQFVLGCVIVLSSPIRSADNLSESDSFGMLETCAVIGTSYGLAVVVIDGMSLRLSALCLEVGR